MNRTTNNSPGPLEYFKELWILKRDRFSYEYSYIVSVDKKPVGLMTCYPGHFCKKLIMPTVFHLLKIGKIIFLWHVLTHVNYFYHFAYTVEAMDDEFYIGTLAVLPEYRNYGVGSKLIDFMKTLAQEQGFNKCSLLVEGNNENCIRFYERNGFEKILYSEKPHAYYRVVNTLDLFNNTLNPPVIVYQAANQSHSQRMPIVVMSPVGI